MLSSGGPQLVHVKCQQDSKQLAPCIWSKQEPVTVEESCVHSSSEHHKTPIVRACYKLESLSPSLGYMGKTWQGSGLDLFQALFIEYSL